MLFIKNFINHVSDLFLSFENKQQRRAPIIYTLFSCLCFPLMTLCVKFSMSIPPYQAIYSRAVLLFIFSIIVILNGEYEIFTKSRKTNNALLTRGLLSGICLSIFFHALYFLPLSYFAVLQRLTPIFIGILGSLFFNETYKWINFFVTIICLFGILLIVQPPFLFSLSEAKAEEFNAIIVGVVLLVINNLGVALIFLTMKVLKGRSSVIVIIFYSNMINMMVSGVGQFYEDMKTLNFHESLMVLFSAVFSWLGQLTRTRALLLEKALFISLLTYSQVVLSYLFDYFILGHEINLYANLGIITIVIAMIYLLYKEGING